MVPDPSVPLVLALALEPPWLRAYHSGLAPGFGTGQDGAVDSHTSHVFGILPYVHFKNTTTLKKIHAVVAQQILRV